MPACFEISYTAPTAETPLTRTMKETFFYFSLKRAAALCLALAAACTTALTLNSCGGGGKEDAGSDGFKITAAQFRSGARGFSIQANSGWEFWSDSSETSATDYTLPDSDVAAGTIVTYGYMHYSFTGNRSQLYGLMRYTYDAVANKGILRYSMDTTNLGNIDGTDTAAEVTYMINTIHKDPWGQGFGDGVGPDGAQGAGGENPDPIEGDDLSTHIKHTVVEFDFNTGTCIWTCGCGHPSQTMDFLIRHK